MIEHDTDCLRQKKTLACGCVMAVSAVVPMQLRAIDARVVEYTEDRLAQQLAQHVMEHNCPRTAK